MHVNRRGEVLIGTKVLFHIPVTCLSSWMLCKVYHCIMLYYVVSDKLIIIIPRTKSTDQCQHLKICSAVIALNKSYIQRARDNIIDILTQGVNTNHHLYPNLYIMINKVFKHSFSFFRTVFGLSNYLLRDTSKKTNSIMT